MLSILSASINLCISFPFASYLMIYYYFFVFHHLGSSLNRFYEYLFWIRPKKKLYSFPFYHNFPKKICFYIIPFTCAYKYIEWIFFYKVVCMRIKWFRTYIVINIAQEIVCFLISYEIALSIIYHIMWLNEVHVNHERYQLVDNA